MSRRLARGIIVCLLMVTLGAASSARGQTPAAPKRPAPAPANYLAGIDRGEPPPALALPSPLASDESTDARSPAPSAYSWGPATLSAPSDPADGGSAQVAQVASPARVGGSEGWALRCEQQACWIQFVPGDFEVAAQRRFAVNLGWNPVLGQFELEARFLEQSLAAGIRALAVEANGRQIALLPFARCNERGTCWYRALLTEIQVARVVNAIVLGLKPLDSANRAGDELALSTAGLRRAYAGLLEAVPAAALAVR